MGQPPNDTPFQLPPPIQAPIMVSMITLLYFYLFQRWVDEYMTWDPADYNGLEEIRVPSDLLWLPDTIMYNT